MTKKIDDLLGELQEKATENHIPETNEELQKEVVRLRKTLESYGILEELHVCNIEFICQKSIDDFKKLALQVGLTSDDAKTLDILHKNLRMARGNLSKKEIPGKTVNEADLLSIVNGSKVKNE
jgi:hypothetical protein